MRRQLPRMLLCAVLFAVVVTAVCGGKGGSPSSPSGSGPSANTPPLGKTYMGSVSVAGVTGLLMVRAGTGLASIARPSVLTALLDLIEPRLLAQAASTGSLTLNDGRAVSLTGSYSGNTFELSGSGYTVTVSVAGGSVSGTVTAPSGTGTVAPIAYSGPASASGN